MLIKDMGIPTHALNAYAVFFKANLWNDRRWILHAYE